jgi:hypothetical protein
LRSLLCFPTGKGKRPKNQKLLFTCCYKESIAY